LRIVGQGFEFRLEKEFLYIECTSKEYWTLHWAVYGGYFTHLSFDKCANNSLITTKMSLKFWLHSYRLFLNVSVFYIMSYLFLIYRLAYQIVFLSIISIV